MPAFRFEAIDTGGRAQKGVLDADSARSARAQLRTQGLTPLVVEPASSAGGVNYGWNVAEGLHCYNASTCNTSGMTPPVAEYAHGEARSGEGLAPDQLARQAQLGADFADFVFE